MAEARANPKQWLSRALAIVGALALSACATVVPKGPTGPVDGPPVVAPPPVVVNPGVPQDTQRHRVALLVMIGDVPYPQLAEAFVATRNRILRFIEQHEPPYIAKIYRPPPADLVKNPAAQGRIELWYAGKG